MQRLFDNTERAFIVKSDAQLNRARFLFEMIKRELLVRIGARVTKFALSFHLPVESLIRATVFDHFCGGVTQEDCRPVLDQMYKQNVHAVLDYSVEGKEAEEQFDFVMRETLATMEYAKHHKIIPFVVFKPTGFGRFDIYQKVGEGATLDQYEAKEWDRIKKRYDTICQKAYDLQIPVLIDAEESWMQDAADELSLQMMRSYNVEKALIFNTAQMYRWDRLDYLKELSDIARRENFKLGIKVVRGAYMEKERNRAREKDYQSPICASKKDTDENFDLAVRFMIDNMDVFSIFLGTHNEQSTYKLLELMSENGLEPYDPTIWFGQLYGMSDNITYNLADAGYLVAKYLPYGSVGDVIPYLIRRAQENTSVAGQTSRELFLIKKEIERRKAMR